MHRRTLLKASAAALAAPAVLAGASGPATAAANAAGTPRTAPTLSIDLQNNTGSGDVYAYVTGLALDHGNAWCLLQADGQTPYYPASPSSTGAPLGADCAIRLNGSGAGARRITVPRLAGGRIWFSIGQPLTFLLNPGPALVEPSVTNPSDPNINTQWAFAEFTFNSAELYANISAVDFVSIPVGLRLTGSGGTQTVQGLPNGALDVIADGLRAQAAADGQGWDRLIVTSGGQNLRALSPVKAQVGDGGLFGGYFDGYVDQVWAKYASTPLTVDTQAQWGVLTGTVSGGLLNFPGAGSFAKPNAADIFSCNSGPFAVTSPVMGALTARLSAALNRSTLLDNARQPGGDPSTYYRVSPTNHYSRLVHSTALDGRGYGFPYDDVQPTGGSDQSGAVRDGNPSVLTVTLGAVH